MRKIGRLEGFRSQAREEGTCRKRRVLEDNRCRVANEWTVGVSMSERVGRRRQSSVKPFGAPLNPAGAEAPVTRVKADREHLF